MLARSRSCSRLQSRYTGRVTARVLMTWRGFAVGPRSSAYTDQKEENMRYPLLLAVLITPIAAQSASAEGKVTKVTLYRGQAMVTRSVPLPDRTGALEIVVPNLPHGIVGGSAYAEGGGGTEVKYPSNSIFFLLLCELDHSNTWTLVKSLVSIFRMI